MKIRLFILTALLAMGCKQETCLEQIEKDAKRACLGGAESVTIRGGFICKIEIHDCKEYLKGQK